MAPRSFPPTGLMLLLLLGAPVAAAGIPRVSWHGHADAAEICVDTNELPPDVDPECHALSARELYEEVCDPVDLCVVQDAITLTMDTACGATGQACDWRDETCLGDVFSCGPWERLWIVVNNADEFTLQPGGLLP